MKKHAWTVILAVVAGALSAGFTSYMSTPSRLAAIESTLFEHGILLQQILTHILEN